MLLSNVVGKLLGESLSTLWAFKCSGAYRASESRRIGLRDAEVGNPGSFHHSTLMA
jgi:hypothetical protein